MSSEDAPLNESFILASGSEIRKQILSDHGFNFMVQKSEVDEEQKKSTDLKLRRLLSTGEWQDLLRDVRKNSSIRILNENI